MARPGKRVNSPATTRAKKYRERMICWCWRIFPCRAACIPRQRLTNTMGIKRWIGEKAPQILIACIKAALIATQAISKTQRYPNIRCLIVPLAATNCTAPRSKATRAATVWGGIGNSCVQRCEKLKLHPLLFHKHSFEILDPLHEFWPLIIFLISYHKQKQTILPAIGSGWPPTRSPWVFVIAP